MRILLAYAKSLKLNLFESSNDELQYKDISISFLCIEEGDNKQDTLYIANEIEKHINRHKSSGVILVPFAHISPFATNNFSKVISQTSTIFDFLNSKGIKCFTRKPAMQDVLFSELLLFDANASTHLRCSENALRNEINSLKKIFGKKILIKLLMEEDHEN